MLSRQYFHLNSASLIKTAIRKAYSTEVVEFLYFHDAVGIDTKTRAMTSHLLTSKTQRNLTLMNI